MTSVGSKLSGCTENLPDFPANVNVQKPELLPVILVDGRIANQTGLQSAVHESSSVWYI